MRRDDRGQIAGVEGVTFGVLVFVVGALVIANAWSVVDAKTAAGAAAREAARSIVESTDPSSSAALAEARRVAAETMRGYGRSLETNGELAAERLDYRRCGRVTIVVRYRIPAVVLPFLGGRGRGFTVTGRHSEVVDPYRSGLPGEAACAG